MKWFESRNSESHQSDILPLQQKISIEIGSVLQIALSCRLLHEQSAGKRAPWRLHNHAVRHDLSGVQEILQKAVCSTTRL